MSHSLLATKLDLMGARPYPPYIFHTQAEKDLYDRLRDIYEEHSHTWDAEAHDAWPIIVEHASLAPSTIGKVTNHYITRHMVGGGVTWAHIVALRVMYGKQLYNSRKLMGLIRAKYPNASLETFGYSEEYTLSFQSDIARRSEAKAAQKAPNTPRAENAPAVDSSAQRRHNDGGLQLAKTPASGRHREMSKGAIEFLSGGDSSEEEPLMWKTKPPPAQNATPKKRAAANNARNESGVESHKRSKKPRHAGNGTAEALPRGGQFQERSSEEQEDSIDIFDKFMRAIAENTKATRRNIKATEENTKVIEEFTRAIEERRSRHKTGSKKATNDENA